MKIEKQRLSLETNPFYMEFELMLCKLELKNTLNFCLLRWGFWDVNNIGYFLGGVSPQPGAEFAKSCDPVLFEVNGPAVDTGGKMHVAIGFSNYGGVCQEARGWGHSHAG